MTKWMTLAFMGILAGCSSTTPEPAAASASGAGVPRANFEGYRTFSFAPANPPADGYAVTQRSLEVQQRLTSLVKASLEKRGYAQAPNGADLLIKVSAGTGTLPGDKTQRGNPEEPTPSGFIGIDAYDGQSGATVWHGSGYAELNVDQPIDDALLASGVEKILTDFPASGRRETASNHP
jgi:Domain of unknown function (DUF4136)